MLLCSLPTISTFSGCPEDENGYSHAHDVRCATKIQSITYLEVAMRKSVRVAMHESLRQL